MSGRPATPRSTPGPPGWPAGWPRSGSGRGDRVGVLMANYLEFVPVKFAIARAGAVAIPFNYLYRQDELGYVLRQSRCSVLVTMTGFGGVRLPGPLGAVAPRRARGPPTGAPGPAPGRLPPYRRGPG